MLSSVGARVETHLDLSLSLTAFIDIEKKMWPLGGIKEAAFGLKLEGSMDYTLDISITGKLRFVGR